MGTVDAGAVAERLFVHFMAPLVTGGALEPGRPIGGRLALTLGEGRSTIVDIGCLSRVQLARVRVARGLVPVDFLERPSVSDWAMGAVLHDIVQSAHPDCDGLLRGRASRRLLEVAERTLTRIAPPRTVSEALSRHTWFSRLFEIGRTDTKVSCWVGSQTFLGTEAPARLKAWPELRRVHVDRTEVSLTELPRAAARSESEHFSGALAHFLRRTPLTDLATCARPSPAFAWSHESLALVATRAGRALALRSQHAARAADLDAALGRAARVLASAKRTSALRLAMGFMAERALAAAELRARTGVEEPPSGASPGDDASYGRSLGAWAAMRVLAANSGSLPPSRNHALAAQLKTNDQEPAVAAALALVGSW